MDSTLREHEMGILSGLQDLVGGILGIFVGLILRLLGLGNGFPF